MSDLAYISASEALSRFRDLSLSPVELTKAVIARAEEKEPEINAFTYRYFEEALAEAKNAEARYQSTSASPRPLEGLCVAIKDSGYIAGQPTSAGSLTTDETPATTTSPINERVLNAGGIVHARSATPEFSCSSATNSRRWGVTRNPWNTEMTPGGSTGGGAAALAVGGATLATGSDIAGSIRIPASCCGVVGYKPPKGRTPVDPPFNLDPYCHTGPLARTVEDAMLFQNVLAGPHPGDPTTLRQTARLKAVEPDLSGWRIGYSHDLGGFAVDAEIRRHFDAALDVFRDLGAVVENVALPWGPGVLTAARVHLAQIFGAAIAPLLEAEPGRLTSYAKDFAEANARLKPAEFYAALETTARMGGEFAAAMEGRRLFLCPTTCIPAVPATHDPSRDTVRVNGKAVDPLLGWVMTTPFNMISAHPALSVPMGRAASGVPTGLQIVAQPYEDADVFEAGLAFERALGRLYETSDRQPQI